MCHGSVKTVSQFVSQSDKPTELEELYPESAVPLNLMKLTAHFLDVLLQILFPRTDLIVLFSAAAVYCGKISKKGAYRLFLAPNIIQTQFAGEQSRAFRSL